jgi:transcriptional regulator with XRE-family HTH domain
VVESHPAFDGDEFEGYLDESLQDPGFRAAYEDADERSQVLNALVKVRQSLKLTQTSVAERMGTSQSFVSDLENGATDPRLSTLQRFARAVTARLRIRIDMPANGPWLPADQGAYAGSPRVTLKIESAQAGNAGLVSSWQLSTKMAESGGGTVSVRVTR